MAKLFEVDVPVNATVRVRANSPKQAAELAREFIGSVDDGWDSNMGYIGGWNSGKAFPEGVGIETAYCGPVSEETCEIEDDNGDTYDEDDEQTYTDEVPPEVATRLEYLRGELRAERISYGELAELQSLAQYISPDDDLYEAIGGNEDASPEA